MTTTKLSPYEQSALHKIHAWQDPSSRGFFSKLVNVVNKPFELAGDLVMNTPGVGTIIEKSVGGLVSVLNDAAQWSVRPTGVYADFAGKGIEVNSAADIRELDLEDVDKAIGYLAAKYKTLALAEGAGTGAIGLVGIPIDVVALVTMNLRAIGEYATYCGFDVGHQQERLFAMQVLGLASSPTDAAKQASMAQLVKIATEVAKKKTWKELERHAFVKVIQQLAQALGIRLTKAKLAQVIPATGAIVGGGFNAYYTAKVCEAAFFLYRQRFLAEKYGAEIIEG